MAQLLEPRVLQPVSRRRQRQSRDEPPGIVVDAGRDAAHAQFQFLVVARASLLAHERQLALELREIGNAVLRMPREARARRVGAHARGFVGGEKELADRSQMQRRPPADRPHDLHARALRIRALDIDDLVALTHREIHRLPRLAMQFAHRRHRGFAHREPRLHQIAEFEQPHAEPVRARIRTVDEPAQHHVVQDAVRRRRMQFRAVREFFEADGIGMRGEGIEKTHHALDDLNGRFGFRVRIAHRGKSVDASNSGTAIVSRNVKKAKGRALPSLFWVRMPAHRGSSRIFGAFSRRVEE